MGVQMPRTRTINATMTSIKNTNRSKLMKRSIASPNDARATSPYDWDPVRLAQLHKMYKLKSVMTAENIIIIVAKPIPHFSNAKGRDKTPPPIIVATKLNVDDRRVERLDGQEKSGFNISSADFLSGKWSHMPLHLLSPPSSFLTSQ
mmetsp:Transcript_1738/g.1652  ORF Transcript_1738/g.1652 Transcript_1738/m.1652 type:complete len:147 (+) Transcript_1738:844-1284(+)